MPSKNHHKAKSESPTSGMRHIAKRGVLDVSALLRGGVIATLSMGRWRAEQRLLPEDLCLNDLDSNVLDQYISLGRKSLIPPKLQKEMNTIEASARYALARFSLDSPFGRFVTAASYPDLLSEMKRFEKAWMEMREKLVNELRSHEKEVREAYRSLAYALYSHLNSMAKVPSKKRKHDARKYARKIIDAIPSPEYVHDSFRFEFQTFDVPMPTILDRTVRENVLSEEKTKLKLDTARRKEEAIRIMNTMRLEEQKKRSDQQIDQFLSAVNTQVRTMVYTVAEAALGSMKKNEGMIGKTVGQLQGIVKRFRMVNMLNDVEVETELNKLEAEIAKGPKERDEKAVETILGDLRNIARVTALELNVPKRKERGDMLGGEDYAPSIVLPVHRRKQREALA